jgi:hypothetical protein
LVTDEFTWTYEDMMDGSVRIYEIDVDDPNTEKRRGDGTATLENVGTDVTWRYMTDVSRSERLAAAVYKTWYCQPGHLLKRGDGNLTFQTPERILKLQGILDEPPMYGAASSSSSSPASAASSSSSSSAAKRKRTDAEDSEEAQAGTATGRQRGIPQRFRT